MRVDRERGSCVGPEEVHFGSIGREPCPPCGMMTEPQASVGQLGFAKAWEETKAAAAAIRLPGECAVCPHKDACHACAAMCVSETGHFDGKPEYVCRMTEETLRILRESMESRDQGC